MKSTVAIDLARGKEVELMTLSITCAQSHRPYATEQAGDGRTQDAHEEAVMMRKLYQELVLKQQMDLGSGQTTRPNYGD